MALVSFFDSKIYVSLNKWGIVNGTLIVAIRNYTEGKEVAPSPSGREFPDGESKLTKSQTAI